MDSQTAKILTLSWVNVCKYEFLTVEDVEKRQEWAALFKIFKYLPWGSLLKKQTDIAENNIKN